MGCSGSREDTRRKALQDDYSGVACTFKPADSTTPKDFCPIDTIAYNFAGGEGKELSDAVGEYHHMDAHADKSKEIAQDLFNNLVTLHEELSKMSEKDLEKPGKINNKYSGKEAKDQINNVLTELATKAGLGDDVKWPKVEPPVEVPNDAGDAADMGDGMGMDMGDMGMAPEAMMMGDEPKGMEGTAFLNPADFGDSDGPAKFPKLMIECMAVNPYFYDLVQSQVAFWDMGGNDKKKVTFQGVAACAGAIIQIGTASGESGDSFGVGWLSNEDFADLDETHKNKENRCLIFPGTTLAYSSEADALGQAGEVKGKT